MSSPSIPPVGMSTAVSGSDFRTSWVNNPEIFVLYRYQPSLDLAIVAFVLFFISTCVHVFQAWKYQTYYFIPFIIGGFFEWTGYVGRIFAHYDQYALAIYVWQTLVLLLGPTLFAATIYMTLTAIVQATHGETCSPVKASWLTRIFICGDVLAFLIQGGGMPPIVACLSEYMAMITKNGPPARASTIDAGRNIVVAGLILQITFFCLFLLTAGLFHYRSSTESAASSSPPIPAKVYHHTPHFSYQRYLFTLYFASGLVLTRSLFRVAEFLGGHAGELMAVEWYLYVFDGLLMFGVMTSFSLWHPGRIGGCEMQQRGELLRLDDLDGDITEQQIVLSDLPKVFKMQSKSAGRVGQMA